eukprot:3033560-Rhodomonas_salina.3
MDLYRIRDFFVNPSFQRHWTVKTRDFGSAAAPARSLQCTTRAVWNRLCVLHGFGTLRPENIVLCKPSSPASEPPALLETTMAKDSHTIPHPLRRPMFCCVGPRTTAPTPRSYRNGGPGPV